MNIDDLLNQPLPSVADDGFSARVMGRVRTLRFGRLFVTAASVAVCVVLALLLLPLQSIAEGLNLAFIQAAGSAAVSLAAAAVILTLLLEREFARL